MTQLEQTTGKYVIENTEIFVPVYTNIHYTHTRAQRFLFYLPLPQAKFLNSLEEKNTQSNTHMHSSGKCGLRNNDLLWLIFHLSAQGKQLTEVLWRKC